MAAELSLVIIGISNTFCKMHPSQQQIYAVHNEFLMVMGPCEIPNSYKGNQYNVQETCTVTRDQHLLERQGC